MSTMGKEHASSSTKKTRYAVMCGKDFIVPSNASKGACVQASYWKGHGGIRQDSMSWRSYMNMITKKIKHGSIVGFDGKTWFRFVNGGGGSQCPFFPGRGRMDADNPAF